MIRTGLRRPMGLALLSPDLGFWRGRRGAIPLACRTLTGWPSFGGAGTGRIYTAQKAGMNLLTLAGPRPRPYRAAACAAAGFFRSLWSVPGAHRGLDRLDWRGIVRPR